MNDELHEIADELRKHLAWQESDGTRMLLRLPPVAAPAAAPVARTPLQPQAPAVVVPAGPPRAASGKTLAEIRTELGDCKRCKLCNGRTQIVFGSGNPKADLVFVGEGPGADEDQQGVPFVGKAGQLLTKMIEAMKFSRDDVYICNVVKCRPPENRTPLPPEAGACAPYLEQQIGVVAPKVIVALGRCATENLGVVEAGAKGWRGAWKSYRGVPVMPTYHPAFLLRSPDMKRPVWEDLQKVMARLGLPGRAR